MMMNEETQHGQVAVAGSPEHAREDDREAERQDVRDDHRDTEAGRAAGVGAPEVADAFAERRWACGGRTHRAEQLRRVELAAPAG